MSLFDATSPTETTTPTGRHRTRRLVLPAAVALAALAGQMAGGPYTVKKGDTLWSLSRAHGSTVEEMARQNGIADPDLILIGQQLQLPGSDDDAKPTPNRPADKPQPKPEPEADQAAADKPEPKPQPTADQAAADKPEAGPVTAVGGKVKVRAGDTLWSIANRSGTTVAVLQAVNDIEGTAVQAGQVIELPSNGPTSPDSPTPTPAAAATPSDESPASATTVVSIYRVQPGDTATSIAARFGISVEALLQVNQLTSESDIESDQYVRIPSTN